MEPARESNPFRARRPMAWLLSESTALGGAYSVRRAFECAGALLGTYPG